MQTVTKSQIQVIKADDAISFQSQVNDAMDKFAGDNPELSIHTELGFCAIIKYQKSETIPEPNSMKDLANMEGITILCKQCPYCEIPTDGRVKWCKCRFAPFGKTRLDSEACEWLYRCAYENQVKLLER